MNWITSNKWRTATISLIIVIIFFIFLLHNKDSKYKALNSDFKAIQSTIKAKDIEILQWQKYGSIWRYRADSLDKEILNNQHIRYVNKIQYIKVLSAIDSITDDGINEYYSTGKVPNK